MNSDEEICFSKLELLMVEGDISKNYFGDLSRIINLLCKPFEEMQNLRLLSQARLPTDKVGPTENAVKRTRRMKGHKGYPEKDINKEITDVEV